MSELYIGLMSGTSMDAIDAVLVDFSQGVRLAGTHSQPLPPLLRQELLELCQSGPDEIERMGRLDTELGEHFALAAQGVLASSEHQATEVRAIGSHGQTIRHRPQGKHAFTLQIGNPAVIAEKTGMTVIADFRRRDMAAGGQGAPLVPAFHSHVFSSPDRHRIILNLGGIANITILPAGKVDSVSGFDTGPANILMDAWCQLHKQQPYDADGEWAASGDLNSALLTQMLAHSFFKKPAPKSTGREEFHLDWIRQELGGLKQSVAAEDVQATLLELSAVTIASAIKTTGLTEGDLMLCGGGAFNTVLWHRLQSLLPTWQLHSTADLGIAPTWVEATAFAWLARQTLMGLPGNLPAVTGAAGPRILGGIFPA